MKKTTIYLFCMLAAFTALAQGQEPIRKGFTIGASAGIGALHFTKGVSEDQTSGDLSLPNLKMGWFVNQRLGIYLNMPGQIYKEAGRDRSFEGLIPSVQYWPGNKWWVSGGFGLGMDMPAFYEVKKFSEEDFNFGKGAFIGTGYEILQRSKWAMDVQTRVFMSSVKLDEGERREGTSFTVALGFTLF